LFVLEYTSYEFHYHFVVISASLFLFKSPQKTLNHITTGMGKTESTVQPLRPYVNTRTRCCIKNYTPGTNNLELRLLVGT